MTAALVGDDWSAARPRPHFTQGKDQLPILQEAGWAPGPVWTGKKSRPHRDSIPDRPASSSVAIPTELPAPRYYILVLLKHNINVTVFSAPLCIYTASTADRLESLHWPITRYYASSQYVTFQLSPCSGSQAANQNHGSRRRFRTAVGAHRRRG